MKATLEFNLDEPIDRMRYEYTNKIEELLETITNYENWLSETCHDDEAKEYQLCYNKLKAYKKQAGL